MEFITFQAEDAIMKRLLIFTLAIMLVAYASSFATLTKTLTMGDANGIVYDDGNIWLYPSTFYNYPDLAIGELYSNDMERFGIHYKFGEEAPLILGAYFTTDQPFYIPFNSPSWDYSVENNDRIDLFAAYMMGENPIGLHINYVCGSRKYEDDSIPPATSPNVEEEGISNLAFDLGITMMQGKADIAAGINFLSWTDIEWNGNDETKPTGNLAFYVMGRYFHEMNQKVTLVPHIGFSSEKVGFELYEQWSSTTAAVATRMTRERKYSQTIIDLGFGMNYSPAAGILAIGDIGFMMSNTKQEYHEDTSYTGTTTMIDEEYNDNNTYLPYFRIGMDATVFDLLDIRLGSTSYWRKYVNEDKEMTATDKWTEKYTRSYVSNSTYLGAGFHWGNLKIDAEIDPELLLDGFYFISGEDNDMAYQITILYEMF
jgi:hypothetical protein